MDAILGVGHLDPGSGVGPISGDFDPLTDDAPRNDPKLDPIWVYFGVLSSVRVVLKGQN